MENESQRQAAEQQVDPRVDLAVQRTELAEDRTLLAWLRTAMALIGAGVAFDKGIQLFHEQRLAAGTAFVRNGHVVGRSLAATTTVLLIFVLWQHRRAHRELARIKGVRPSIFPPTAIASVLVILLGIAAFTVLMISS